MERGSSDLQRRLGAHLARVREQLGISQEALAVQLRHDQSYLSRIEAGERQASLLFLLEWAYALDVPFTDLAATVERLWRDERGRSVSD